MNQLKEGHGCAKFDIWYGDFILDVARFRQIRGCAEQGGESSFRGKEVHCSRSNLSGCGVKYLSGEIG